MENVNKQKFFFKKGFVLNGQRLFLYKVFLLLDAHRLHIAAYGLGREHLGTKYAQTLQKKTGHFPALHFLYTMFVIVGSFVQNIRIKQKIFF